MCKIALDKSVVIFMCAPSEIFSHSQIFINECQWMCGSQMKVFPVIGARSILPFQTHSYRFLEPCAF